METLKELLGLLEAVPPEVWVLLLGLVFGVGATHYIKRRWLPEKWRTPRIIEGVSTLLTALPITRFWPGGAEVGLYVGLTAGLAAVLLYKPVMRWAYAKWPSLEDKVSAKVVRKADGTTEVRDITVPSGEGEKTLFIGSPTEPPK
jgi:hypothetical protein